MKIGTLINFKSVDKIEGQFKAAHDSGFSSCQFVCWLAELYTDENVELIKSLCKKYDMEITAFWCGWTGPCKWNFYEGPITLGLVPAAYRHHRTKELIEGAIFAEKLGITDVITHMGFIPENPNDPTFNELCSAIKEVAEHMKAHNQYLLFETGQETPVTMLRCFETVGTDNLGVNLDTGNLILYGKANPVDALDVFGKYVRNIHAKDGFYPTEGRFLGKEVEVGCGKVDFRAFFTKLKELGYDSFVTIEREISAEGNIEKSIKAKAYLEEIINEVYGG